MISKPDLINKGSEQEVLAVVLNVTKPLKYGYFMLKNASENAKKAGMSRESRLIMERDWFRKK